MCLACVPMHSSFLQLSTYERVCLKAVLPAAMQGSFPADSRIQRSSASSSAPQGCSRLQCGWSATHPNAAAVKAQCSSSQRARSCAHTCPHLSVQNTAGCCLQQQSQSGQQNRSQWQRHLRLRSNSPQQARCLPCRMSLAPRRRHLSSPLAISSTQALMWSPMMGLVAAPVTTRSKLSGSPQVPTPQPL